ncbi:PilN domain-containing protein [Desulfosporosinus sp. BICA1-9]|uniref:PilN domain-containing protein n=1 Tax=Desulfosporosinus sp. BICA1-9 TaxID=1531958 RepID=UPI00054BA444|nr:PilN domain-containing protein [Desulfosporosinus sp. BICA1-9]KJS49785.1 MAG: hypothetical protein VR66_06165 [Peptococcaceae bacterium BRH_c23]KJS78824.1 MAG: hypothetical protein JL57_30915 [Desulfosporosinus sp. BICA1-9]HBW36182.1 hypothetical protein [Desulfosporosinus sp.]
MKEKREFNFAQRWIEGQARESESPSKLKTQALTWGIGGLVFLGVIGSTPWLWEYKLSRDLIVVEDKISLLREISNQVSQLKTLKSKVEEQEKLQNLMKTSTRDPGPILEKLKNTLPIGAVVNSFSLQENNVSLSVSLPTPVDVARLWVSLRDSGMFLVVDIQTVSLKDQTQTMNFNLTLK